MKTITQEHIDAYRAQLFREEKAAATLEKYVHDVAAFAKWCGQRTLTKELMLEYKQSLTAQYAPASVNTIIASLNGFFTMFERYDLRIKPLKIQRQIFAQRERELTRQEYERLLRAAQAKKNMRLYYLMQTVCATGIRISELRFITVEAVRRGQASISCKGKMRIVFLPKKLCSMLVTYTKHSGILSGSVFVSKNGVPLDRSNIWSDMKKLCAYAGVEAGKVFPHNLRHLFARTYYQIQKDIVRLADILGHSSVNTTRIYTMETGDVHRRQIQQLGLLRC